MLSYMLHRVISSSILCLEAHMQFYFRYDPEIDGRILMGKVDCTEEVDLCKR